MCYCIFLKNCANSPLLASRRQVRLAATGYSLPPVSPLVVTLKYSQSELSIGQCSLCLIVKRDPDASDNVRVCHCWLV
jgi:hypothetical protein